MTNNGGVESRSNDVTRRSEAILVVSKENRRPLAEVYEMLVKRGLIAN